MTIKNNKKAFGSKERALKRKQRSKDIIKHVEYQINDLLPELSKSKINIDKARYRNQMYKLDQELQKKYPAVNEYRIANNFLAKFINDGNKDQQWELDVPLFLVRIVRESPLRTEKWFDVSRGLNLWEQEWRKYLNTRPTYRCDDNQENILSALLISASFYGGLCLPEAISALANQLRDEPEPLMFCDGRYWVDLVFRSGSQADNVEIDDNGQTLRRWYPDKVSLVWIHHFLSKRESYSKNLEYLSPESCWKLIKNYMLLVDNKTGSPTKSFNLYCRSSIGVADRFSGVSLNQACIEFAVGKIPSASLPKEFQESVFKQSVYKEVSCQSLEGLYQFPNKRDQKKSPIKSISGCEPLISQIRKALKPMLIDRKKNTRHKAKTELGKIPEHHGYGPISILILWLSYLLEERKLKVSTVYKYYNSIGKEWILKTLDCDIYDFDEEDFEGLYLSMLDGDISDKTKYFKAGCLERFHLYAHRNFDLPLLNVSLGVDKTTKKFVRAGFITENLFEAFCKSLENSNAKELHTKHCLLMIYILAFRTGLRRSELLKLRIKDIENSNISWLYVRNNKFGDNKSTSASRKIPLAILLKPHEKAQFDVFLSERKLLTKFSNDALLFSFPLTPHLPLDGNWVSVIAKFFLEKISDLPIIFHHFRHTALSRLQVVLENDPIQIKTISSYSSEQVKNIQTFFGCCEKQQNKRDVYWILAGIAGHLNPGTTFANYLHFTDLILANKLDKADVYYSKSGLREISNLSSHSITRLINQKSLSSQLININAFQIPIINNLKNFRVLIKTTHNVETTVLETNFKLKKIQVTIELCHAVLKEAEKNATLFELAVKFSLEEDVIHQWITNAKALAELKTSKNKLRLFSIYKADTENGFPLAPPLPQSTAELKDANQAITILRKLFVKEEANIKWCIGYYLSNTNRSSSGLNFDKQKDLKRFLKLMLKVFPDKRWNLRLKLLESIPKEIQVKQWKKISENCNFTISKTTVKRKTQFSYGQLELFLSHPDEQKCINRIKNGVLYKKYSTNTMSFIFHMIAIMKS